MSDWFNGQGSGVPVDVEAIFDSRVPSLLGEVVSLGALVGISRTRDGGALGITVTNDGRWRREYFRDADSASDWLLGAVAALGGSTPPGVTPIASTGRSRPRKRP